MGHYYVRLEDGTEITIHPDVYDQQFYAYLERIGIKRTSCDEIMRKAEEEWQAYCRVMDAFAENVEQWLDTQQCGVFIERLPVQSAKKEVLR
jgi:glutamate racemase